MSSAVREDAALNALKVRLGAPNAASSLTEQQCQHPLNGPVNAA